MAQLVWALVGIVHGKVLVKVNGVEDGDELYSYQHLVAMIRFWFRPIRSILKYGFPGDKSRVTFERRP